MPRQHLKKRKDGRYCCKYKDVFFYGETESEALTKRDEYKLQLKLKQNTKPQPITVRSYALKWLPIHKHDVSKKTYADYAKQIDALLLTLGDKPIDKVTPTDVKAMWQHYEGYSASTIRRSRFLFNAIFDTAKEEGIISINPFTSVHAKPPKGPSGSHRAITDEERELILASTGRFRPAVMTMLYAGLRRGEVLSLDIDRDVDFINHKIYVREAIRFDNNKPVVTSTKTEAGEREIPLFSILENELRGLHGLLVPAVKSGKRMSESAFRSAWNSYILGVECQINHVNQKRWYDENKNGPWKSFSIRPHDLRHSFCTMLCDAGVNIKLAIRWMGHADEKMIMRIYDHITDYRIQQAIKNTELFISGSQNGSQEQSPEFSAIKSLIVH